MMRFTTTNPGASGLKSSVPPTGILRKEKVPIALNPTRVPSLKSTFQGHLHDSTMVIIVNKDREETYTIHRPIGHTDLSDDDWVITPTSEITHLLARKEDPDKDKISLALAKARDAFLVSNNLVVADEDGELFYENEVHRVTAIRDAKAKLKAAKADGTAISSDFIDYLEDPEKVQEMAIRMHSKTKEYADAMGKATEGFNYRTRSGPIGETDQVSAEVFAQAKPSQLVDLVSKLLIKGTVGQ